MCTISGGSSVVSFAHAQSRRIFKDSRRWGWDKYITTINRLTPVSTLWRKRRSVCGLPPSPPPTAFLNNISILTTTCDVANLLASSFALVSRSTYFSPIFRLFKDLQEGTQPVLYRTQHRFLNLVLFSFEKFQSALTSARDPFQGVDNLLQNG